MHYKKYKKILSAQNGMNIYRGCTHGCIYCDTRSNCYQLNHEFTDIEVKEDAFILLDNELSTKRKPCMVGTGSMSDPYLHLEKELQYTRKCLEVILKHHCGLAIQTKSDLILRDMDLLDKINKDSKCIVEITLTTADDNLCKIIEPNVCVTSRRVEVLKKCNELGIKTVVWLDPFLPFINDTKENLLKLLDYCSDNNVYGVIFFGIGLTLRDGNREYFYQKLDEHFPGLKQVYMRKYGLEYQVMSDKNNELSKLLFEECQKRNIVCDVKKVFEFMRTYPQKYQQLSLFDNN